MRLDETLFQCLRYFVHTDEANAAMHTADVRYSPITFRVAEALYAEGDRSEMTVKVMGARATYPEDPGR